MCKALLTVLENFRVYLVCSLASFFFNENIIPMFSLGLFYLFPFCEYGIIIVFLPFTNLDCQFPISLHLASSESKSVCFRWVIEEKYWSIYFFLNHTDQHNLFNIHPGIDIPPYLLKINNVSFLYIPYILHLCVYWQIFMVLLHCIAKSTRVYIWSKYFFEILILIVSVEIFRSEIAWPNNIPIFNLLNISILFYTMIAVLPYDQYSFNFPPPYRYFLFSGFCCSPQ